VAGEVERGDEPLTGGASRQRIHEQPTKPRLDEDPAQSIDATLDLLRQIYGARIEATRRAKSGDDRRAAVAALRLEWKLAVRALKERRRADQAARREARRIRYKPGEPGK
jgi:hypothetical protein